MTEQRKRDLQYEYNVLMWDINNDINALEMLLEHKRKRFQEKEAEFVKLHGLNSITDIA